MALQDHKIISRCTTNPHMLIPWFLLCCYAYGELDDPIASDATFDWLCAELNERWETLEHWHKGCIVGPPEEAVKGCLNVLRYPTIVKDAATRLAAS